MRINENCVISEVCGEFLAIKQGKMNQNMTQVISLNETAVDIWRHFEGADFEIEDVAKYLMDIYDIDESTALSDANRWATPLVKNKVIEC